MTSEGNTIALQAFPLFPLLTDAERRCLQDAVQMRSYRARSVIVRAGAPADGVYMMLSGRVNVSLEDGNGHQVVLEMLGPGELFGETCFMENARAIQTFEALDDCEMLFVPRRALLECLEKNAPAAMFLARILSQRIESAHRKIASLAFQDVYGRVVEILLTRGAEKNGEWHVEVGAERIAAMVGASREMISRVIKDLIAHGVVHRERRQIIVNDRTALREWAKQRGSRHKKKRVETGIPAAAPV